MLALLLALACSRTPAVPGPEAVPGPPAATPRQPSAAEAAPIAVEAPRPGATVGPGPLHVEGTASVWEGVVEVVLEAGGRPAAAATAHTGASAPARAPFAVTLQVPEDVHGPAVLRVFGRSARDGSPQDEVRLPLVIR